MSRSTDLAIWHGSTDACQPVGWVEHRETHHLPLCYARVVTNYRRNFICGGSFLFTANLAERRLRLLVDYIDLLRQAFRYVRRRHPFDIEAIVILPDHLHAIWTLPEDKQTSQSYVESVENDP
jgi:hypothetical protein